MSNPLRNQLHKYSNLYHIRKKIHSFWRNSPLKTLFSTNLSTINSAKIGMRMKLLYHTVKPDIGKISNPFREKIKSDAKLQTQRPTEIPFHYGEKQKVLNDDLQKMEQFNKSAQNFLKIILWNRILSPLISFEKKVSVKNVVDARHLNSKLISHQNYDYRNS